MNKDGIESSSFRDPSGFVFWNGDTLYRQINNLYKDQYEHLMSSGLFDDLAKKKYIVQHKEVSNNVGLVDIGETAYKVIQPDRIPFISYCYEWCFGQLKDAALLTLKVHRKALDYDMILKDASTYNIQFNNSNAIFIDTLSFDFYKAGQPWVAYGQFCRHFLAPLFLMKYRDVRLLQLIKVYID